MNDSGCRLSGLEQLVEKCRAEFRCPENTDHYTHADYKDAERKYIKFCLNGLLFFTFRHRIGERL